ncbi:hypothetical protein OG453_35255 [Streptomyces sp. NBC_01381]|uniref:hypothetical protein n=1 Tax=Streptomyces sp. NBC_01381 TaxID=2903845 RepID=UPI0022513A4D|nr:hypothetical protein [Streptomyces sp. NBC_01381]MCX4671880.1 hypothetical protein [Streptomyces sp. NBC_01381]
MHWYTVFGGERLAEATADLVRAADDDVRSHGSWYGQEFRVRHGTDHHLKRWSATQPLAPVVTPPTGA